MKDQCVLDSLIVCGVVPLWCNNVRREKRRRWCVKLELIGRLKLL